MRAYAQDIDGGEPRVIGPEGTVAAIVSPDGRSIVAITRSESALLQAVEGGESRLIPGVEPGERPIGWSEDGRSLYVAQYGRLAGQVYRLDPVTGRRELLLQIEPRDAAGVLRHEALLVSGDGASYAYSFIRSLSELYLIDGVSPGDR